MLLSDVPCLPWHSSYFENSVIVFCTWYMLLAQLGTRMIDHCAPPLAPLGMAGGSWHEIGNTSCYGHHQGELCIHVGCFVVHNSPWMGSQKLPCLSITIVWKGDIQFQDRYIFIQLSVVELIELPFLTIFEVSICTKDWFPLAGSNSNPLYQSSWHHKSLIIESLLLLLASTMLWVFQTGFHQYWLPILLLEFFLPQSV